jgi:hypothetical protein
MKGDDRTRFCSECNLHVYNFAELTRDEAEALVNSQAGQRLCGRVFRRPDGTIITRDCSLIRRAARRTATLAVSFVAGALLSIIAGVAWATMPSNPRWPRLSPRNVEPFRTALNWLDPPKFEMMGDMPFIGEEDSIEGVEQGETGE